MLLDLVQLDLLDSSVVVWTHLIVEADRRSKGARTLSSPRLSPSYNGITALHCGRPIELAAPWTVDPHCLGTEIEP
jgi:hypothetical protein